MTLTFQLVTGAIRPDGCFSMFKFEGRPFAVAVERTFEYDKPVIKAGRYWCKKSFYHKGGYPTYEIEVQGHSEVKFHKGNTEKNSTACVCVAESFGQLGGETAVLDSKHGFNEFMALANDVPGFWLEVTGR